MDKSRRQFEEWRSKNKSSTINLFDVWQASRESLEIELPEFKSRANDMYYDGFHSCLDAIREELISNGVKIKNGN
ncbi:MULTISPECIES: hypothetical protein [Providencia]|uniref:hypothetical protein n=1 Tax=Providencia TaxID=586 RepID=UPI001EF67C65|nr:hypothetical protein [Providencia rettgeri]CAB5602914.1 Uncharacterised protein [Providencia rettgeri]CAC9117649.1 Uncharacterised protein [Providencia rettgeri]CAC9131012.1 Uncharacterised protein [Providencia rettgeri]